MKPQTRSRLLMMALLILALWIGIALGHGMFRIYSWYAAILVLPLLGLMLLIGTLISIIVKRRLTLGKILSTLMAVVMILPISAPLGLAPLKYPVDHKATPALSIPSPFKNPVTIIEPNDNPAHGPWPQERLAYDLVAAPYDIGSSENADYGIWDMPVYAPITGTVIATCNDEPDIIPNSENFSSLAGNYVYIKVKQTGTYLMFIHLKEGSVAVKPGDTVTPGQLLGAIGNSGTSSEPHLHLQHQRQDPTKTLYPLLAEGLPLFIKSTIEP